MTSAAPDILGLGCTAIDDLVYVGEFPAPDSKIQVRSRERHCGGITATALVAAARLGSSCVFAGVLGEDELSRFVIERFEKEGVSTKHIRHRPEARPIHAIIIVDEVRKTRTILYDLEGAFGAEPDWPGEELIRSCRVLFVDHFGMEGMIRAAKVARSAGNAVVADLEDCQHPRFSELLPLVDHLVLSRDFAARLTGRNDPAESVRALHTRAHQAVVVTAGARGCWYLGPTGSAHPSHQPAFEVETIDTTGCGDVFHGTYASALARGLDLRARIRFASAVAALKATKRGGQAGIPDRPTVEEFLYSRSH